jgi:peptide alpha-N-acetyltransferase
MRFVVRADYYLCYCIMAVLCLQVVLETEITNKGALSLYEKMGFARDKRLGKYYLNGVDAYRLKLWFK